MSYTESTYTIDSATRTQFDISFSFFSTADVKATLNGVSLTYNTDFTVSGTGSNQTLSLTNTDDSTRVGKVLRIYRDSINASVDFVAGASINADDLNNAIDRALYVGEENRVSPSLEGDLRLNDKFLDGILKVKRSHSNSQPELRLYCKHDDGETHYAAIRAPNASDFTGSNNVTFKIPSSYPTANGQVLSSDMNGTTSWVSGSTRAQSTAITLIFS